MTSNRVTLLRQAWANLAEMSPDVERQARGLIVMLAASPLSRLVRRLDIGMATAEGIRIWAYQDDDFWLYYIEEPGGSLTIVSIWER